MQMVILGDWVAKSRLSADALENRHGAHPEPSRTALVLVAAAADIAWPVAYLMEETRD